MSLHDDQLPQNETVLPIDGETDDYEVITSEEVDRILDALDQLIESTESENIIAALEEAADTIYGLIYDEESDEAETAELEEGQQEEAA